MSNLVALNGIRAGRYRDVGPDYERDFMSLTGDTRYLPLCHREVSGWPA